MNTRDLSWSDEARGSTNLGERERVMELRRENPPLDLVTASAATPGTAGMPKESIGGMNFGLVDLEFLRANAVVLLPLLFSMELRLEIFPPY